MASATRITTLPRHLAAAEAQLIAASSRFGLKVFREIEAATRERLPNLFLSPLSVTMALGMLSTGAAGETREALDRTLELGGLGRDDVNRSFQSLIAMLRELDPRVQFLLGNSIWCRHGITFSSDFLEATRVYFDARVESLDFGNPAAARRINDWVWEATGGRIADIVGSPLPPEVWMYVLNAIYFKGDWTAPFDPELTSAERFQRADGSTTTVPMMASSGPIPLGLSRSGGPVVVDIPYGGGAFSMTIVLPREASGIWSLMASVTADTWTAWMGALRPELYSVRLPKFKLETDVSLNSALCALGLGVLFDPHHADFSEMRPAGDLFISEAKHKSYIDVNEAGTEAAAATAVFLTGSGEPIRRVVVDRPFVFAIRENLSGTILFLGRVLDPAVM